MAAAGGRTPERRGHGPHSRPGPTDEGRRHRYGHGRRTPVRRRVLKVALWTLAALPVLVLLAFALPVTVWRTGERAAPPLTLVKAGPDAAMPRRLWIDTDAACGHAADADADDCFALLLLLRAPGIEVVGISTVGGNAPADAGERIVRELAALAGRQPPVH